MLKQEVIYNQDTRYEQNHERLEAFRFCDVELWVKYWDAAGLFNDN